MWKLLQQKNVVSHHYLVKPFSDEKFNTVLQKAVIQYREQKIFLCFIFYLLDCVLIEQMDHMKEHIAEVETRYAEIRRLKHELSEEEKQEEEKGD